jgi:DNA mismatch repair protein MutS2
MRPRDLETLELPRLLDTLAGLAASSPGAEQCRGLTPSADPSEVDRRLRTLAQYLCLSAAHPEAPRIDVPDLRPLLTLAAHDGAALDGQELAAVLATLRLATAARRYLRRGDPDAAELSDIADRLDPPRELVGSLSRAIDDAGRIRDEATPALAGIRTSLRGLRANLEARLGTLLIEVGPEVAAEEYVTLRNDRFVVPVRASAAQRLAGVIQDRSSSGETIFLEPLFAVEENNRGVLLRKQEEAEERRICRQLTEAIGGERERVTAVFAALVECDVLAARAALARRLDGVIPVGHAEEVRLVGARHPFLILGERRAVPIDLLLPAARHGLVVTGPNTGGKTVALKTTGLLALMAQCGLAIPAREGSTLPFFTGIYADIGDTQSIERSLSTFSAHMENLAEITRRADARSLVVLDEPGVGTDPAEGGALAVGVLGYVRACGAFVVASSHSADVKTFALADADFEVAAAAVDTATGAPGYVLHYHTLGQSLALPMARRLGIPEAILSVAEQRLAGVGGPEVARAAERLEATRRAYEQRLAELDEERTALAARQLEHAALVARLKASQRTAWQDALAEAREFVGELRLEGQRALEELRQRTDASGLLRRTMAAQEAAIAAATHAHAEDTSRPTEDAPMIGDEVEVVDQGIRGELIELDGERARILRGALRFEVPAAALRRIPSPRRRRAPSAGVPRRAGETRVRIVEVADVGSELTVIGLRARDAVARLDAFLDRAIRAGHGRVRIVHGIGTGALLRAVHQYLADAPYCASFREAAPAEGGAGVTVVELAV